MNDLPEGFDSVFRHIVVVSQRAEQLLSGARPRIDREHAKPTLVALDEVNQGLVKWRVLTAAELEAQRQAMVEQLRAEMGAEEAPEGTRTVPDVLPTSAAPGRDEVEDEGRDDELSRLQRLLGMAGALVDEEEAAEEASGDGDEEDVVDLSDGDDLIGLDDLALEEEASADDADDDEEEG